jgi:hypothetical protein
MADKQRTYAGGLWDTYLGVVQAVAGPAVSQVAASTVSRLVGFWVMWHLTGGYEGMRSLGWGKTATWKNRIQFRDVFGVDVEDFMPVQREQVIQWRGQAVNFPPPEGNGDE